MNEDVFPIENRDFPASHVSFQGGYPLFSVFFKIRCFSDDKSCNHLKNGCFWNHVNNWGVNYRSLNWFENARVSGCHQQYWELKILTSVIHLPGDLKIFWCSVDSACVTCKAVPLVFFFGTEPKVTFFSKTHHESSASKYSWISGWVWVTFLSTSNTSRKTFGCFRK